MYNHLREVGSILIGWPAGIDVSTKGIPDAQMLDQSIVHLKMSAVVDESNLPSIKIFTAFPARKLTEVAILIFVSLRNLT